MDSSSIELPGSIIRSITHSDGCLRVRFSPAYIIKTITGSIEGTRWRQEGDLIMDGCRVLGEIPLGPLVCTGGSIDENIYTYRDMLPIPLNSRGRIRCDLGFKDCDLRLVSEAESIRLEMLDIPKYIEHRGRGER